MSHAFDKLLDARGLNCPTPLIQARRQLSELAPGQVLKVVATDRGSVADFLGWARIAKNMELVRQETEFLDGTNVFVHFVKRTA